MPPPSQTVELCITAQHAGARLDAYIASQLPWRSRRSLVVCIDEGAVRVNGRQVKKSFRLTCGDAVRLELPRDDDSELVAALRIEVLFEDDELVVLDKPVGLAVHPASTCPHVHALAWLRLRYRDAGDPTLEPSVVHRLDRTTSGVVAFTKRRSDVAFYTGQFERRTVAKRYLAIVHGCPPDSGRIEHPLLVRDAEPVRPDPRGKPSRTDYRVLTPGASASEIEARPHTGRKHQIRVHLAALGHPLVGDDLYGPDPTATGALLHAAQLELDHRNGQRLRFVAPPPASFAETLTRLEH